MIRRPRGFILFATAATAAFVAGMSACKEGSRAGAGPNSSVTPTPSGVASPTPEALSMGTAVTGTIPAPGSVALFQLVTTTSAVSIALDVDAEALDPIGNTLDARLTVFGPNGTIVAAADDGTTVKNKHSMKDPFLVFIAAIPGTYTVRVDDANGDGGPTGFGFSLLATAPVTQPFDGGTACANAVLLTNLNAAISGDTSGSGSSNCCGNAVLSCVDAVVRGKERVYKAVLTSGQNFQAVRTSPYFDGAVYLTDSCGGSAPQIDTACKIGGDGHDDADGIVFRPAVTGTYYLYVDGVSTTPTSGGPFRLDLRTF